MVESLQEEKSWEDGLEAVLQLGNKTKFDEDDFALKLINAHIIGRYQIVSKINSKKSAEFSVSQGEPLFSSFDEARKFMISKVNVSSKVFDEASDEMKKYAFTVSSMLKEDIIINVSDTLLEHFDKGQSFHKFKTSLRDGELSKDLESITNRQLELMYTQNMNSAYSYGRYQGLIAATDIFPNWEYITIGDNRVRPAHAALNGVIRHNKDPFWDTHYPPNGFRCRCIVEVTDEDPNQGDHVVAPNALDKGFDHNVGQMNSWVKDRISQMNDTLAKITTRTSFFNMMSPLKDWDKSKKVLPAGKDYAKIDNGLELAKNRLKKDLADGKEFFDKNGNLIGVDVDYVIDHISTSEKSKKKLRVFDSVKWNDRAKLVDRIKEIVETGEIVEDIERYGKSKQIILSRKYLKNVSLDGVDTPVMIVVEYPKNEKDSIPVLTTIYPFSKEDQNKKVSGISLK
ncbi:MAG: phage minor head protein [Brevinema sp.]